MLPRTVNLTNLPVSSRTGRSSLPAATAASVALSACCSVRPPNPFTAPCEADNLSHLALEGADLTVTYLPEEEQDVKDTADLIRKKTNDSRKFQFLAADLTKEDVCQAVVQKHLDYFGGQLDTLICNHGNQDAVSEITELLLNNGLTLSTPTFTRSSTSSRRLSLTWRKVRQGNQRSCSTTRSTRSKAILVWSITPRPRAQSWVSRDR